ncbi:antiactivator of flagellar biosynthesis FleN protein [Oxalobacteraceae bacterium R-40]|uniref:Antiactivator of flagellar biosynthesis FleN protein n=1 Tax=Keguizhuia sedimenti TaxID=3064264 RepID=A0ABU1BPE2_9BURK|nr:antiactivator of flagellar biosynthesis FleN protein [Oxalobacteraceae bacterium R-40]
MASFDFDQAEGLRRMLAGPRPRVITFVSAASQAEKNAMLVNLGASLANTVHDVLLLDAQKTGSGIASRLRAGRGVTLQDVCQRKRALQDAVHETDQGFRVASFGQFTQRATGDSRKEEKLDDAFGSLAKEMDVMLVDAELDENGEFPIASFASGEIVMQVSADAASIKSAYALVKQLNAKLGKRPYGILVTGTSEKGAQRVYANMAQAASRYLAVQLQFIGFIPADEHLVQAARLGRTVIDAFPMAHASVAFRSLAGRFASSAAVMA